MKTKIFFCKNFPSNTREAQLPVLPAASGTISKFDRIGKQCGFDTNNTIMKRIVTTYNPEPNADKPLVFEYFVDEKCEETWGPTSNTLYRIMMNTKIFLQEG